jgi:ferredoxin
LWFGQNCIGCFRGVDSCDEHALTATGEGILIDRVRLRAVREEVN